MKKWLLPFVAATMTCVSALPVMADTTNGGTNDHAYISSNVFSPTVGSVASLQINLSSSTSTSANTIQIKTSLGSLNGQGASLTLTPDSTGTLPTLSLTSTQAGQATISVYENGIMIGSTQVTFLPGALANVSILATPSSPVVGSSANLNINATDIYGNPVQDYTLGTTFNLSTNTGQLVPSSGSSMSSNGSTVSVSTHNGFAQAMLTSFTAGTAVVTVTETNTLPAGVKINGNTGVNSITIPINFSYSQSVTFQPINDFKDTTYRPALELESERELSQIGVLHGDLNHYYFPNAELKRSEFAQIVAQYMGLSTLATGFNGYPTKFADVNPTDWFDGAVAADASFGYFHGDGTYFYPNKSISYAEVAMVLLNNLGATVSGSWPDRAITGGNAYGLFNGLGSFNASDPATRGDVAIMVRNALHLVPPAGGLNTNGKTMESELLGYTWSGDQAANVIAVPGTGVNVGNELQVTSGGQSTILHLANTVTVVGATTINDLMGKNIKYLTNALGVVTYIEVTQ